jgi:hypothetical protein
MQFDDWYCLGDWITFKILFMSKFIPKKDEENADNHALKMALAQGQRANKRYPMQTGPQMTPGNKKAAIKPRKG